MTNTADIESIAHVRAPGAAIAELLDANPADLSWQQEFYTWMHLIPSCLNAKKKLRLPYASGYLTTPAPCRVP